MPATGAERGLAPAIRRELKAEYGDLRVEVAGRPTIADWPYFMAFGIFRLAAIAQGVFKRSLQGNASSDNASSYGAAVTMLAELGCSIAAIETTSTS